MTTEIAIAGNDSDITVLPPARPVQADAVGQLMAHAQAMTAAKQLADALCDTDLVPKDYKGKPGNGAAAILYGAELGLNPIQSLQQVFVVHGSPAIYARTAVALVMRHGITVRTLESSDDSVTVEVSDPRTGHVETCTWDYARAQKAGYTGNKKYDTDPQAMLYAKAAMEGCRKVAPDVLLGIPMSREELEMEAPTPVRSERVQARGVAALREAARTHGELLDLGLGNQRLVVNAVFRATATGDEVAGALQALGEGQAAHQVADAHGGGRVYPEGKAPGRSLGRRQVRVRRVHEAAACSSWMTRNISSARRQSSKVSMSCNRWRGSTMGTEAGENTTSSVR